MSGQGVRPAASKTARQRIGLGRIFVFWVPLAITWLMMALEGPFLAAVIARLAQPKHNLAAFGVAFAFAIIIEAPVIMILSASTALVEDARSFRKLRNFTHALNGLVTAVMLAVVFTPLFDLIMVDLIGLSREVASLTHVALVILIPWPAVIGYRRFYQGLLIRGQLTRRVAYGTVVRLSSMAATGLALYLWTEMPGAWVGATALTVGVCAEAAASRGMAQRSVTQIRRRSVSESDPAGRSPLGYGQIMRFYYPLALTSTISLAAHPTVTFFMGQARDALESLAVLPVINSLSFIFRSVGLSYQEVAIAFLARGEDCLEQLERFASILAVAASAALTVLAWTPLATWWFHDVSGLSPELTAFAILPIRIVVALPALSVLLSLERAILVHHRHTAPITWATALELGGIIVVLMLTVHGLGLVGATAAGIAYVVGRLAGNLYLVAPCVRARQEVVRDGGIEADGAEA